MCVFVIYVRRARILRTSWTRKPKFEKEGNDARRGPGKRRGMSGQEEVTMSARAVTAGLREPVSWEEGGGLAS